MTSICKKCGEPIETYNLGQSWQHSNGLPIRHPCEPTEEPRPWERIYPTYPITITAGLDNQLSPVHAIKFPATVEIGGQICIGVEGYGEKNAHPGNGTPIIIEVYRGTLRVIVFGDINSEEPTEIISLDGARESKRE